MIYYNGKKYSVYLNGKKINLYINGVAYTKITVDNETLRLNFNYSLNNLQGNLPQLTDDFLSITTSSSDNGTVMIDTDEVSTIISNNGVEYLPVSQSISFYSDLQGTVKIQSFSDSTKIKNPNQLLTSSNGWISLFEKDDFYYLSLDSIQDQKIFKSSDLVNWIETQEYIIPQDLKEKFTQPYYGDNFYQGEDLIYSLKNLTSSYTCISYKYYNNKIYTSSIKSNYNSYTSWSCSCDLSGNNLISYGERKGETRAQLGNLFPCPFQNLLFSGESQIKNNDITIISGSQSLHCDQIINKDNYFYIFCSNNEYIKVYRTTNLSQIEYGKIILSSSMVGRGYERPSNINITQNNNFAIYSCLNTSDNLYYCFIQKIYWENDWPVFKNNSGTLNQISYVENIV